MLIKHYGSLDIIYELDGEDFIDFVYKAFEREDNRNKEKINEFLLHRWGYELNYGMEKPIGFEEYLREYRRIALDEDKKATSSKNQQTNEELIEEIERIKKIDQELNGAKGGLYK